MLRVLTFQSSCNHHKAYRLTTKMHNHALPSPSPQLVPLRTITKPLQCLPSDAPQRSEQWFAIRKQKLTTSTFSTALGFWKADRRITLWQEKVFPEVPQPLPLYVTDAMNWGVAKESTAINHYKTLTGREVGHMGFATHPHERMSWLGASPDGILEEGLLEVKCPYNKGKPEQGLPWGSMPFYYMPQVQGQLEIMDKEWADLYCWTVNGSTIIRVNRDRGYWEMIHGLLREFWWENVVPARDAVAMGAAEEAEMYRPAGKHRQTGAVVKRSISLAEECKVLCREIAGGSVEFFH